jgi:glycosyltransferase involved in cell wall biosynthesis
LNASMKLSRFAEPGSLRKAHVVTCESSFGMNYLRDRYPHLRLLQVEHAPSPIFSQVERTSQHHSKQPFRILCVGMFEFWKGAPVIVEALAGLLDTYNFELLWLGSRNPALEQEMRAKAGAALWKHITFRHNVPSAEIAQELSRTTLFLHAALADNSPNAVKEAVVAGVPIVATHTGGIPDYVLPGKNGFLFESGNAADCRQKLVEAMSHPLFSHGLVDPETLQKMRVYLSAKTMAEKFREGYNLTLRYDPRSPSSSSSLQRA